MNDDWLISNTENVGARSMEECAWGNPNPINTLRRSARERRSISIYDPQPSQSNRFPTYRSQDYLDEQFNEESGSMSDERGFMNSRDGVARSGVETESKVASGDTVGSTQFQSSSERQDKIHRRPKTSQTTSLEEEVIRQDRSSNQEDRMIDEERESNVEVMMEPISNPDEVDQNRLDKDEYETTQTSSNIDETSNSDPDPMNILYKKTSIDDTLSIQPRRSSRQRRIVEYDPYSSTHGLTSISEFMEDRERSRKDGEMRGEREKWRGRLSPNGEWRNTIEKTKNSRRRRTKNESDRREEDEILEENRELRSDEKMRLERLESKDEEKRPSRIDMGELRSSILSPKQSESEARKKDEKGVLEIMMEKIKRSQYRDDHCIRWIQYLDDDMRPEDEDRLIDMKKQEEEWITIDRILYHYPQNRKKSNLDQDLDLQLYIPSDCRLEMLRMSHDDILSGHQGIGRSYDRLRRRCYWKGMKEDVVRWISGCEMCSSRKNPKSIRFPIHSLPYPIAPFEMIGIDVLGPLPRTERGNEYIVVITDYLTRWVEAFSTKDQMASTIAQLIVEGIMCRYGCPKVILSDRGTNFLSSICRQVYDLMGVDKRNTSAYHPNCLAHH